VSKLSTIPNILTLSRIFLLPFFALGFFFEHKLGLLVSSVVFTFCCLTDYLDGYYARNYSQTTKIGQILDPLADKILISISLLFISGFGLIDSISIIPASIILCREIIISGLREGLVNFKTSKLSKWKTAIQMLAITLVLFASFAEDENLKICGEIMLWGSSGMAIASGLGYYRRYIFQLRNQDI
jgi:cardiolipin synthase